MCTFGAFNMINEEVEMTDFSNSFFLWETVSGSEGRFNLESITEVISGDKKEEFLLLSSVMACDVYGKNPLFHDPSYLFEAVFGAHNVKIFRTYQNKTGHTTNRITDMFKSTRFLNNTEMYYKLESFKEISEAVRIGYDLLGQAKYKTGNNDIITVKFPVKHINISEKTKEFQVETGKILFYLDSLEKSLLAYLAFNNFNEINFLAQDGRLNSVLSYEVEINIYRTIRNENNLIF